MGTLGFDEKFFKRLQAKFDQYLLNMVKIQSVKEESASALAFGDGDTGYYPGFAFAAA